MIAFYNEFISPLSPKRAKLSVHLLAQAAPKVASAEEQRADALSLATSILVENDVSQQIDKLSSRLNGIVLDASSNHAETLLETIASHVSEDLNLPAETAEKVLSEAKAALGLAVVGPAGEQPEVLTEKVDEDAVHKVGNGTTPVYIKDVLVWKAGLLLSKGVKPVKDLEEFVEGSSKL